MTDVQPLAESDNTKVSSIQISSASYAVQISSSEQDLTIDALTKHFKIDLDEGKMIKASRTLDPELREMKTAWNEMVRELKAMTKS